MYLIPPCLTLSNTRYVSRIKWRNPGKGVVPSLHLGVVAIEKGAYWSPSTTVANFTLPLPSLSRAECDIRWIFFMVALTHIGTRLMAMQKNCMASLWEERWTSVNEPDIWRWEVAALRMSLWSQIFQDKSRPEVNLKTFRYF